MRYAIIWLIGLLSFSNPLSAQFLGGQGDGFSRRLTIQLDLTGVPVGVRPLYVGGGGDGADQAFGTFSLGGQTLAVLYGGGWGDGFDQASASFTIGGQSVAILYGGGEDDGFDWAGNSVTLGGQALAVLYQGGSGDGFDREGSTHTLSGQTLAILYEGGSGDGFDRQQFVGSLAGGMFMLYSGGSGDGFDRASGLFALNGVSLSGLYAGGQGDGFAQETYFGSIPVPLLLIRFDAFPEQDYVLIQWLTENEVATDFFTVEKTRDGRDFSLVGQTAAAYFSEPGERLYYELKDQEPYVGTSYYRLTTTDLDGAISLSHLVEVQLSGNPVDWDFQLFPNPNTGSQVNVRPTGIGVGERLVLEIFDSQERQLLQQVLRTNGEAHRFDLPTQLSAGSYLIRMIDERGSTRAKLLLVGR